MLPHYRVPLSVPCYIIAVVVGILNPLSIIFPLFSHIFSKGYTVAILIYLQLTLKNLHVILSQYSNFLPVVPHKAVAEVSKV